MHELLAEQAAALQAAHLRLRLSDRMASIGALAAGLGHDMNNVLLPVRAHLNAARAQTMNPNVRRHVEAVEKSVAYLQQLADGLHFLALDSEHDDIERSTVAVRAWWTQVGPLLTKAVPKHVKVTAKIPAGLPEVGVSAHGLTQAVLNLVVNAGQAISADQKRRGRVRIQAATTDGGASVTLAVSDNGSGMPAEVRRNAFEMFYTTKTRGLGTGLGLPMVARVVASAGGSVHIDSEVGKGTTVTISVPIANRTPRRSRALNAVVTLTDGRAAALIQHLLDAAGACTKLATNPNDADVWVTEPTSESLAKARAWRRRRADGVLVLIDGSSSSARSANAWSALLPVTIDDGDDLEAIRTALSRAMARV